MQQPTTDKQQDSFDLVLYLWGRRKLILGIMVVGLVAGGVAAFWITPLYKSEVVMFPAITNSVSKALLSEQSTGRDDILALGDEEDSEQLIQMLHSERIRDRVAARFDLMKVYEINTTGRHRNSELHAAYARHIKSERTRFSSVRVEVLDPDPQRAADIANFITEQVDTVWKEMARERAGSGVRMVRNKVLELEELIGQMSDSMRVLRELGVHDYHTQTERYNEYLGAAIVKGDQRAVNELEERFKVLARYGGLYVTMQDRLHNETRHLSVLRTKLEQAEADMESDMPHKFVVNRAQPSDKKHSPVRWLVVAISMVSSVVLAVLALVVQANIHKIRRTHG